MAKVIITLQREDNSIIGDPIVREVTEPDFDNLIEEFDQLVSNPDDELATYQILGA